MWVQVDNEFQQVKIKELNEMNNIKIFPTNVRETKKQRNAAEQKIRELKTRISKVNAQKLKISSKK